MGEVGSWNWGDWKTVIAVSKLSRGGRAEVRLVITFERLLEKPLCPFGSAVKTDKLIRSLSSLEFQIVPPHGMFGYCKKLNPTLHSETA